jgi:hypothetical protein
VRTDTGDWKAVVSKEYKSAHFAGFFLFMLLMRGHLSAAQSLAPRVPKGAAVVMTERPGALRRTVLVACPGSTRLSSRSILLAPTIYMKAITEDLSRSEPVGIVISRGTRAEPAPVFCAFVWGIAPEQNPVPRDTKAA